MAKKPTAETILRLKDEIIQLWRQLPIEHQATMLLVLIKDVINENHYKVWLMDIFPLLLSSENHEAE